MHVPIAKHRIHNKTFEKIIFIFVFAGPCRNSRPSQIHQKCAPGHHAPKTAPDGASGADFQVGFRWASNRKFLVLLSSTTRPFLGGSDKNIPQGGPGFTSGFAFHVEESMI